MTLVHPCAICATRGLTCCQGNDRDIYVTPGDVRRIELFSGLTDFFEFRQPTDLRYLDDMDDPTWTSHVFKADHSRRVIRRQASGDCHFLTPTGCQLPMQVRPLVCRLHPLEYNAAGIFGELAEECPLNQSNAELRPLEALGINHDDADSWHQALYQEILWETENDEHRFNL